MSTLEKLLKRERKEIYSEKHGDLEISVIPSFVPEQSSEADHYYFFSYDIVIQNHSAQTVYQLLSRKWVITDGQGRTEEVRGKGVVGMTPNIEPLSKFHYQSFCPLRTPTGNMRGHFEMLDLSTQEKVILPVPLFFLRHPKTFLN